MKTVKNIFQLNLLLFGLLLTTGQVYAQQVNDMSVARSTDSKKLSWNPCPPFMPEGCEIAVLHGDPAEKNLDVFFKVPPGYDIPNHYHTSPERMVLVSGELHVTYAGEKTTKMKTGDYAYGPAEKPHIAKCTDGDPCILFIAFVEPLDAFPFEGSK